MAPVAVPTKEPTADYRRLFTGEELAAYEENQWTATDPETEEYDKELEDRLYPLNEELSAILNIPMDVLARTKDATLNEMGSPEYWLKWYQNTLASSQEAKRANRDFSNTVGNGDSVSARMSLEVPTAHDTERKNAHVNSVAGSSEGEVLSEPCELEETTVICTISVGLDSPDQSLSTERDTTVVFPLLWRGVARRAAYELMCEEENAFGPESKYDRPCVGEEVIFEEKRAAEVLAEVGGAVPANIRDFVYGLMETYYYENAPEVRAKFRRRGRSNCGVKHQFTPALACEDCSLLFQEYEGVREFRPGLRTWDPGIESAEETANSPKVSFSNKRYLCSLESTESIEATSVGYIDCLPSELLMDTGAFASLVDKKVLKRLGLSNIPLRPYSRKLKSASGNDMKISGEIDLPLRLGSVEETVPFFVASSLHVDAILGMDVLATFRAVINAEEQTLTLKETREMFRLGVMPVSEPCRVRMVAPLTLELGHQVLVAGYLDGDMTSGSAVLVEGVCSEHPKLRVQDQSVPFRTGELLWNSSRLSHLNGLSSRVPGNDSGGDLDVSAVIGSVRNTDADAGLMPGRKTVTGNADYDEMEVDFAGSKLNEEQRVLLRKELEAFQDLFVETSKKPSRTDLLKFSINTGPNAPVKQRPYRVSQAEGAVMEAEIQQYLELGIIRPSSSPWASPVLMIRKPEGGIRFCIDYRRLNALTVKHIYLMPLIDDIQDVLGNARLFSTMDIASGYWNVPMAAESIEKTAFTCKYGLYEWLVMPFGLCNAVPAFERLMETVLVDPKWKTCLVYIDDCVVFSSDFPTHLIRLRQVLALFRAAGFKLKMKKCHWGRSQVTFLGHIVTPSGILPNPEKVKAVMNVQRPFGLHTLRAFLGLTSYFRRYIPGYAALSASLERLKQKEADFLWDSDCECAFKQLKSVWTRPPILVYPDFSKRFKLYVDSSRIAVGACLMQTVDGKERAVAYATLTWVFSPENRTSNAKLARWAMELSQLNFKVYHKPGASLGHVDGLSRLPSASGCAITIDDLLNADKAQDGSVPMISGGIEQPTVPGSEPAYPAPGESPASVGESPTPVLPTEQMTNPENILIAAHALAGEPSALTEASEEGAEEFEEEGPDDEMERSFTSVDEFGLNQEKFVEEQKASPWIGAMRAFIEDGALALDPQLRTKVLRTAPNYDMKNGILMRRVHLRATAGPAVTITDPVIPLPFIETVLHYLHRDTFSAHVGNTEDDSPVQAPRLLTRLGKGWNKYIRVFTDYFIRWVEASPVLCLDSVTFIDTMINGVISRHGVLERLLSDRGSNFTSELAKSFYETLGIKKLFGAAYHPQRQGLVERFNGTLLGMLKMYVNETQTDWDLLLPRLLFAHRTSFHEALETPHSSVYTGETLLCRSMRSVERQLIKAQDRHQKRLSDQTGVKFEEGDAVWVFSISEPNEVRRRQGSLPSRGTGPIDRPFTDEVHDGVSNREVGEDGPLLEDDLPPLSFAEDQLFGGGELVVMGVDIAVVDILARRVEKRELQYLVLTANYTTAWVVCSKLEPYYKKLVDAFEDSRRETESLPSLRRSTRLADANAVVDDEDFLF
ncbi:unnamed protein product [Phytophthora fragariaefolia]|uniref:Unnamed protein product n=1 Tax=Phytophthora fragariaefolia TaxID=1490495 RepID=A0A9W6TW23_9STRA|nr:unnamed protein product [Phytophthora fragariaefolia]